MIIVKDYHLSGELQKVNINYFNVLIATCNVAVQHERSNLNSSRLF